MRFITDTKRAKNLLYAGCLLIIIGGTVDLITGNTLACLVFLNLGSLLATLSFKSEKFIKLPRPLINFFLWATAISICGMIMGVIFFPGAL